MADLPKDRLLPLTSRIEQQRKTIEALKRDGHECPDAERQLRDLEFQWHADTQNSGGARSPTQR